MKSSDKILHKFTGKDIFLVKSRKRLPNKPDVDIEMIVHPGAVCLVPFISKDRVVLLRQYRPAIESYHYELPAGTLDQGENPLTCARRELKEETGYTAKRWTRKGRIYPLPAYADEEIIIYKAEGLTLEESSPEDDEVIEVHPMTKAQIRKLFFGGKLVDAKTISALAFCGIL